MLATRLQRAHIQLQSHRQWLRTFLASQSLLPGCIHSTPSTDRPFSSTAFRHDVIRRTLSKTKNMSGARRPADLDALAHRNSFLEAVEQNDLKTAVWLYAALPQKKPLLAAEVHEIARLASYQLREEYKKPPEARSQDWVDEIVGFAIQLTKDIQKDNLMPSVDAHLHLLAVFKESKRYDAGVDFWKWLQAQDETCTTPNVMSVVIEILAHNGAPLQELEQTYQDALARFPGPFSAYHLSPEAVLPDREVAVDIKGLPLALLGAITSARLMRGDTRNAYLALDTVLRLYPESARFRALQVFIQERSLSEVYTIYAIACRAGLDVPGRAFKELLTDIRRQSDVKVITESITNIRVMIAVTYLRLASSSSPVSNSVNELIVAISHLFRAPGFTSLSPSERKQMVDSAMSAIRAALVVFSRYGAKPTTSTFNAIIANIAGYGQARHVVKVALADMERMGLQATAVTSRSILTAAGLWKDAELVEKTWAIILEDLAGADPQVTDLHALLKAAARANMVPFAQAELDKRRGKVDQRLIDASQSKLDHMSADESTSESTVSLDVETLSQGISNLQADLAYIEERTRDRSASANFKVENLPMTLFAPPEALAMPEQEMRKLYDELTTDPTSHPAHAVLRDDEKEPAAHRPNLSSTNIPLGELRYQNWKSMNYLLWLAEKHDKQYEEAVDKAIAAGEPPPPRPRRLTSVELESMHDFGLSNVQSQQSSKDAEYSEEQIQKARAEILRLRGRT